MPHGRQRDGIYMRHMRHNIASKGSGLVMKSQKNLAEARALEIKRRELYLATGNYKRWRRLQGIPCKLQSAMRHQ